MMPKKLTPRQKAGRENRKKWKGFTPEGIEALSCSAISNQPWKHSTGPRTPEGKQRSRENAIKHGGRAFATLPVEAQSFISGLRAAEKGAGPVPNDLSGLAAFMDIGGFDTTVRACRLIVRHQRLTLGLLRAV